ncbi:hypothetical protein M419DRAFT_36586 [Trichoderma reesei RUT C-30]|uniref:Uncharacterized protein n=1 Tax=Hypocrea jecorina (strain ATCC 56765 / BCRC 32924 / NRRL 11460 / Rut C-30) TaxID=1344414 RepID=A0A024S816_HYPJR|nr:hypothetical protein M419DRAFT_36586 [Trichoderma reesei RUT C-30]
MVGRYSFHNIPKVLWKVSGLTSSPTGCTFPSDSAMRFNFSTFASPPPRIFFLLTLNFPHRRWCRWCRWGVTRCYSKPRAPAVPRTYNKHYPSTSHDTFVQVLTREDIATAIRALRTPPPQTRP